MTDSDSRKALSRREFLRRAALAAGATSGAASGRPRSPAERANPGHASASGSDPMSVRLLRDRPFTFMMYGCPSTPGALRDLIRVMRERGLGNGFDPGPPARAASKPLFDTVAEAGWPVVAYPGYADMQVKEGTARLRDEDEAALAGLDRAGVFNAIQLGEWGYYFHNLSTNEAWWRDVYGAAFESMRHLMKPVGLAGYDRRPADKHECFKVVRDYFQTRNRFMRGRNSSVTGHSHYEAYAAEWGALAIGLELGENIAFTQSKVAFARGATRQWDRPFSVQMSPWFSGACTTSGPLRREAGGARGLDAGHSLSLARRIWLYAWFSGAAWVTPENSIAIFFEEPASPWRLTPHGEAAAETFAFMRSHDRGVPHTPVAVILDRLAGYNGYQGRPWGILDNTPGDLEVRDLLDRQLFPGSDFIHRAPDPANPERRYLCPTPFGESFDVLLSTARAEIMSAYPVLLLAGDLEFDPRFVCELLRAVRSGSRLLVHPRHAAALGDDFARLRGTGRVELLEPGRDSETSRPTAISNARLEELVDQHLPIAVEGDPIQYAINRTRRGWALALFHNDGVTKFPDRPAVVDPAAVATVRLTPRVPVRSVRQWGARDRPLTGPAVTVHVPPGEAAFVEWEVGALASQL